MNVDNTRFLGQYQQMGMAPNIGEFVEAVSTNVAAPWVNTIAADRHGKAFYEGARRPSHHHLLAVDRS